MQTQRRAGTRKSLPLTDRDMEELAKLRESWMHRAVLSSLCSKPLTESSSEAMYLQAIVEAGMKSVRERVEAQGYAMIARDAEEYDRQAVARRRQPAWADE